MKEVLVYMGDYFCSTLGCLLLILLLCIVLNFSATTGVQRNLNKYVNKSTCPWIRVSVSNLSNIVTENILLMDFLILICLYRIKRLIWPQCLLHSCNIYRHIIYLFFLKNNNFFGNDTKTKWWERYQKLKEGINCIPKQKTSFFESRCFCIAFDMVVETSQINGTAVVEGYLRTWELFGLPFHLTGEHFMLQS